MSVLQHLHSRYFDTKLHTHWVDEEEGVATFPLWNLTGKLVGYQQYRPAGEKKQFNHPKLGKYFTYRKNRVVGVWGLESWHFSNALFVTEGVFDATRLTYYGVSAVATLSNDPCASTKEWFRVVRASRPVVVVCDSGSAGFKLRRLGHAYHVVETGDLGDASDEYVKQLVKEYG